MAAASLIPLVVAALMALALARRRGGSYRLGQVALLVSMCVGAALLLLPVSSSSTRLVVVRDVASTRRPDEPVLQADLQRLIRQFSEQTQRVDEVQVILLASDPAEAAPAPQRPCAPNTASWKDARPQVVVDPSCALRSAIEAFERLGQLDRLGDLLRRRASRVLVQIEDPARWHLTNARKATALTDEIASAVRSDVRVDVAMVKGSATQLKDPTLRIEVPRSVPSGEPPDGIDFTLVLEHDSFRPSGPLPPWTRECWIDPGLPTAARLSPQRTPTLQGSNGLAKELAPLNWFVRPGAQLDLVPGFHLVDCTVRVELEGKERLAQSQAYFRVVRREIVIVNGGAGGFRLSDEAPGSALDAALQNAGALTRASKDPWPADVPTIVGWTTDQLDRRLTEGLAGAGDRPRLTAPLALVLHDFPDEWYQRWCGRLQHEVEAGLTLIISGAPSSRLRGTCDFLPGRALATPSEPTGKLRFDRTPRVTVSFDPSRLGYLTWGPPGDDGARAPWQVVENEPALTFQKKQVQGLSIPPGVGAARGSSDLPAYDGSPLTDACGMWQQSNLEGRLHELTAAHADRLEAGHLVLAFSYDLPQTQLSANEVWGLLERGARVVVAFVHSPFAGGVTRSLDASGPSSCQGWRSKPDERISAGGFEQYTRTLLRQLITSGKGPPWLTLAEAQRRFAVVTLDPLDAEGSSKKLAEVRASIAASLDARSMMLRPNRFGRLIDERIGEVAAPSERREGGVARAERWAAPASFEVLVPSPHAGAATYATVYAGGEEPYGLDPKPAVIAGPWGTGSVAVFGYSLFEGLLDDGPFKSLASAAVASDPRSFVNRRYQAATGGPKDAWGVRRLADVATFTAGLEPAPGSEPWVAGLAESAQTGRVEIEVAQQMKKPSAVRDFGSLGQCEYEFASNCTTVNSTEAALVLSRVDFVRQRLVYSLLGSATKTLCQRRAADGSLEDGPACTVNLGGVPFYLRNRNGGVAASPVTDLKALEVLQVLARYTGGDVVGRDDLGSLRSAGVSVRTPAALLIIGALCALWTWRLWRRVDRFWAYGAREREERRRGGVETAFGALSAAGDALGRASTETRVGAFGGFHPLGPGDRLDSVMVDDLVAMSNAAEAGVPRVVRRIEEKARRVWFMVDVGRSSRVPRQRRELSAKLSAAARVVELLGGLAWRGGAEVSVLAMADGRVSTRLGPLTGAPSPGAIGDFLANADQGRGRFGYPLRVDEVDDGTTVIVVSDFLSPDLSSVRALAADLEDSRSALGGVHVYSRAEDHLVDVGVAASSGLVLERSELTPAELAAAREELATAAERAFAGTRGGLCSIGAELTASEALLLIRDSSLWGLFS